jgi:hypothetical protein
MEFVRTALVLALFSTLPHPASAQALEWVHSMGGGQFHQQIANATVVDSKGALITIGTFVVTTDLDPGPEAFIVANNGDADGVDARNNANSTMLLWAGNAVLDDQLKYEGADNDRDPIFTRIGGMVTTATTSGYWPEDVSMDGMVKYVGLGNDRAPIVQNIGGNVPTATRAEQLP